MYNRNDCVMKTLVSCVKDKLTYHDNYFCFNARIYMCVYIYICRGVYLLVTCIYVGYICMLLFYADYHITLRL